MPSNLNRPDKWFNAKARPLILAYWLMPLATGLAVTLVAAGMLTEVIVLANRIDSNVTPIKLATADIQVHANGIAVLNQVDTAAKSINTAAEPLSGQASQILDTVGSIEGTVSQIDSATGSILSHAGAISARVDSIAPHVRLIAEPVEGIVSKLHTTIADLDSVLAWVGGVKSDTGAVLAQPLLPTINDHARSIDCHLGTVAPSTDCGNP